ncbi:hypothetical protein FKM82_008068 [Ascaphus truei]
MSTAPKWKMDIDCVGGKGDSNSAHCTTVNEILERSQLSSNSNISRRSSSSSKSECKTPDSSSYDSRSSRSGSEHSEKSPNWSIRDKTESPTRDGSIKQADTKGEGKGANKKVYHRFSTNACTRTSTFSDPGTSDTHNNHSDLSTSGPQLRTTTIRLLLS